MVVLLLLPVIAWKKRRHSYANKKRFDLHLMEKMYCPWIFKIVARKLLLGMILDIKTNGRIEAIHINNSWSRRQAWHPRLLMSISMMCWMQKLSSLYSSREKMVYCHIVLSRIEARTNKDTVTPEIARTMEALPTKIYHINLPQKERNWKLHFGSIYMSLLWVWSVFIGLERYYISCHAMILYIYILIIYWKMQYVISHYNFLDVTTLSTGLK